MRERLNSIVHSRFGVAADKFCNSAQYIVAIAAVCGISYFARIPIVGACFFILLVVPALLFCKNSFVLVAPLLMFGLLMNRGVSPRIGQSYAPAKTAALCVFLAILVVAFFFHLIYYGKYKLIFKKAYLTVSLAIMSGALMLGGVGTPTFDWHGFGTAARLAVATFLPYSLLVNCGEYKGKKTFEYVALGLVATALLLAMFALDIFFANGRVLGNKDSYRFGFVGFFGPNTGAAVVALAIPVTFYFVYTRVHGYLFMVAVVMELLAIFLCQSRASFVIAAPVAFFFTVVLCFKKKVGRLNYWITVGVLVLASIAILIACRQSVSHVVHDLLHNGVNDSGRFSLWRDGFKAWEAHPVFGVGLYYLLVTGRLNFYSFHCTPLTYLFCAGIVGFVAYVFHRSKTVRLVFSAKLTAERVFVALAVLAMLLNALLDVAMTKAAQLLFYAIMLAVIECDAKHTRNASCADVPLWESPLLW